MTAPAPTADLPLLHGLNPEQRAAVTLPAEHALILAGAGSGKTRVLTTRMAWLLQTGQVSPGGILAVTFTNKAAREMLTRISALLPLNVRGMWIGTFHGLAHRLLRRHWQAANLPQTFQILDTQDQLSAIKRLCKQYDIDRDDYPPRQLQWFISGCKERGERPQAVAANDPQTRRKVEIYQLYEAQCQREGVVDFGELMLRSFELLQGNEALRMHYRHRFRHVLIDEFQDTNRLQYAWIKMIVGLPGEGGGAILAVGDDDQSIYAFRGARVANMRDFVREFDVQRQIKLEQNYRSDSNILDAANALIAHNEGRLGKNLRTERAAGEPVRVYEAESDFVEARWVVEELQQLVREQGLRRRELAVLYRSNAQSRVLESALFNAGVPYRVYGGLRFFERAEIKHALAYLRLLENPDDDTSFLRVANFPPRGVGARTLEALQDAARAAGTSLHQATTALDGRAGAKVGAFVASIDVMREQTGGCTLREIIQIMLEASGLLDHYRQQREGQDRVENLHELVNAAESFVTAEGFGRDAVALPSPRPSPASGRGSEQIPRHSGEIGQPPLPGGERAGVRDDTGETMSPLAAFLTHAALEAGDNQAQAGQDAVQLMTVHASKGLEFDAVFITGLEEGLFPHENALSDEQGLEEERRLMYVAITRARQRLYLSRAQTRMLHGQTRYHVPSRFLAELPERTLKWITPRGAAFGRTRTPDAPVPDWVASRRLRTGGSAQDAAGGSESGQAQAIAAGMTVFHNKFGEGRVRAVEGSGAGARAQVAFRRHGVKWLALSVAKLTVVE
ncbi:MAG: UvrD-helicase domain-containing protein [Ottowia sp.]|nr:UvrD-helicase domain-containing protein [Ottowia sp.]